VLFYRKYERIQGLLRNAFIADRLNNGHKAASYALFISFLKKQQLPIRNYNF